VVDHVRAVAFAIADGQLPSNTGSVIVEFYVVLFVTDLLLNKEPFVNQLVGVLANQMGEFFPEIKRNNN
jgi:alanyl-tRNA synthetase